MDKKGLELSLTMIVTIILSIIIFIGALALMWKFFAGAEEIKGEIDRQTVAQIESLLRQGTDIVAMPVNAKEVSIGKDAVFGLGIRNLGEDQGFYVVLGFAGIYDKEGRALGMGAKEYVEEKWLGSFKQLEPVMIRRNKYEIVPIYIKAATSVDEGVATPKQALVVFNVCVFRTEPQGECSPGNPDVYDKIKQVFIETK
ncbi:MAG: hypothetical protein QXM31_02790 [Candidatus Woesearchaeota archaeon]